MCSDRVVRTCVLHIIKLFSPNFGGNCEMLRDITARTKNLLEELDGVLGCFLVELFLTHSPSPRKRRWADHLLCISSQTCHQRAVCPRLSYKTSRIRHSTSLTKCYKCSRYVLSLTLSHFHLMPGIKNIEELQRQAEETTKSKKLQDARVRELEGLLTLLHHLL